jgi:Sodium/hydrogen exchanger family.
MRALSWLVPAALLAAAAPTAAHAATELPRIVQDMGVGLLFAGALAIVFHRLGIPSIAAFILAGFLLGPQALALITDAQNIDSIAQIALTP